VADLVNPYSDPGLRQVWDEGHKAGKRQAAETLRKMLKIMATDRSPDIAQTASLLLEGMGQVLNG
jgi:hypothetical protein